MKIAALINLIFVSYCVGQQSTTRIIVPVEGQPHFFTTNIAIVPVETVWEKSWEQPRQAEVSIAWEPSPDAVTYNVYMLSARTTNKWVLVSRDVVATSFVFLADMSVNIYTRITAVNESRSESAPTNPVKHPSVTPPRPPGQHRHMYTRELTEVDTRRSRARPEPILPILDADGNPVVRRYQVVLPPLPP